MAFSYLPKVFTLALADKLKAAGSKVKSVVAHPGYSATNLQSSSIAMGDIVAYVGAKIIAQTAEDGTLGILTCALQPDVANGAYYGPKRFSGPAVELTPKSLCTDKADHDMLWRASSEAVGDFTVSAPAHQLKNCKTCEDLCAVHNKLWTRSRLSMYY